MTNVINLVRDSKGRMRNANKLTTELKSARIMGTNHSYSLAEADNSPIGGEDTCDVPSGASLDALKEQPNMNWTVEARPIFDDHHQEILNKRVITRTDTGQHIEVVSNRYVPVQNLENIEFLRPLFDTGKFTLDCAGTYHDGARAFIVAKRADSRPIEPVKGDEIYPFFGIRWGHDGQTPIKIQAFATRVFCTNVFPAIDREAKESEITIKHRAGVHDAMDVISEITAQSVKRYADTEEALSRLARAPISRLKLENYFRNVLKLPYRNPDEIIKDQEEYEKLMKLGERKLTWLMDAYEQETSTIPSSARDTYYHAWNAVTRHVTHDAVTQNSQSRFEKAINGLGSQMSNRAYTSAIELAVA